MHPGVGPTRSRNMDRLLFNIEERGFKDALDGRQPRLNLPAVVLRAVVRKDQLDAPHAQISGLARSRFLYRYPIAAQRAFGFRVSRYAQTRERHTRNTKIRLARAAVNDGSGGHNLNTGITQQLVYFARTAARCDDVFDHDSRFARLHLEATAQRHLSVGISFREDATRLQRAGDFMPDDQTADRRRGNHVDVAWKDSNPAGTVARRVPSCSACCWMLKHQRTLHIFRAMQPAGQPEMPVQVCASAFEQRESFVHDSMIEDSRRKAEAGIRLNFPKSEVLGLSSQTRNAAAILSPHSVYRLPSVKRSIRPLVVFVHRCAKNEHTGISGRHRFNHLQMVEGVHPR